MSEVTMISHISNSLLLKKQAMDVMHAKKYVITTFSEGPHHVIQQSKRMLISINAVPKGQEDGGGGWYQEEQYSCR